MSYWLTQFHTKQLSLNHIEQSTIKTQHTMTILFNALKSCQHTQTHKPHTKLYEANISIKRKPLHTSESKNVKQNSHSLLHYWYHPQEIRKMTHCFLYPHHKKIIPTTMMVHLYNIELMYLTDGREPVYPSRWLQITNSQINHRFDDSIFLAKMIGVWMGRVCHVHELFL